MIRIKLHRFALVMASVSAGVLAAMLIPISVFSMNGQVVFAEAYQSFGDPVASVELPHTISCTSVEVVRLASYDGPFYEDGSGREVRNVAAL